MMVIEVSNHSCWPLSHSSHLIVFWFLKSLLQAGSPVDALIEHLLPKLESGDCLVDAGNEFFEVSEKREKLCSSKGVW